MGWVFMVVGGLLAASALYGLLNTEVRKSSKVKPWLSVTIAVIGVLIALFGYGLKSAIDQKEQQSIAEVEPLEMAVDHRQAIASVGLTLRGQNIPDLNYKAGDLQGGVAVVAKGTAGYWVKDGVVYAVNGIAKNWSPGIEFSPAEITWSKVEEVVQ